MDESCLIEANPDIAGVGVRSAIYIQNFLCFLPAIWALWDGKIVHSELEYAETQTTTNLVLAFAILISSVFQANNLGLSNYHAGIVLSMSWMNNTNAFVYFILYIHHKIGLPEGKGHVEPTWTAWAQHVKDRFSLTVGGLHGQDLETEAILRGRTDSGHASSRQGAKAIIKRFVLILGSLHLTLMAALGVWLWSDIRKFSSLDDTDNACAYNNAVLIIFGQEVSFRSEALRISSLIIYALFLVPGLNLVLPVTLFLGVYFGWYRWGHSDNDPRRFRSRRLTGLRGVLIRLNRAVYSARRSVSFPAYLGLAILFAINLVFMVDIELTLRRNESLQKGDEKEWGFGQILAILLLFLPLRDLVEALLARRLKQRQRELEEDLREAVGKGDFGGMTRAVERGIALPIPGSEDHLHFWTLVSKHGATDKFDEIRRSRMTTAEKDVEADLHAAILERDSVRITSAYVRGADLIAGVLRSQRAAGVILRFAIRRGHQYEHIWRFLARHPGPHVNKLEKDGQTPLMYASGRGFEPLVTVLLDNPTLDINVTDGSGKTALMMAVENMQNGIASLLSQRPELQPNEADTTGTTALMLASRNASVSILSLLLQRPDIDVNQRNREGQTALAMATSKGRLSVVERLLQHPKININLPDGNGRTPLMHAALHGHEGIAKALLERPDIRVNVADRDGTTALILASEKARVGISRILLERADLEVNRRNSAGHSALTLASRLGLTSVIDLLLRHSETDVNFPDAKGCTALMHAVEKDDGEAEAAEPSSVQLLFQHPRTQINTVDGRGATSLIWAALLGRVGAARLLLQHPEIDTNHCDIEGNTALIYASMHGHLGVVELLLKVGRVDLNVANKDGQTATSYALAGRHLTVVELLGRPK